MLNVTNLGGGSGNAAYRIITVPSGVTEYSFNWDVCNAVDHVDASVWSGSYSGSFTVESLAGSVKITFTDETTEAFQMYVCILSGEAAPDGSPDEAYYTKPEIDALLDPIQREMSCIFSGADGIVWDLDELMGLVRAGKFNKFAIGDCIVDNGNHWRVFAKKFYPKWSFDGAIGEAPFSITLLPDEVLGTHAYNSTNTNAGGYPTSLMPAYLEELFTQSLSEKLRSYVVPTQIYENAKGSWANNYRNMRLPTIIECTGSNGWADQYSGSISSQLPLMMAMRHRIKTYWYWCLDPVESNITDFCGIAYNGYGSTYYVASRSDGSIRPEITLM